MPVRTVSSGETKRREGRNNHLQNAWGGGDSTATTTAAYINEATSEERMDTSNKKTRENDAAVVDLPQRLGRKIRSQAAQLADLTEKIQHEEAYSRLVEARLLEIDPAHPLPVTPRLLHRARSGELSGRQRPRSSTVGAARRGRGVSQPGGEDGEEIRELRRGNETAQERLKDAAQLIRQLREALETRDAEAKTGIERARKFQREASDLRRKLSGVGGSGVRAGGRAGEKANAEGREGNDVLKRKMSQLMRELEQERKACALARADADVLRVSLERRRPRHLDDDMDDANAAGQRQKKVPIGRDENIVRDAVEQTNQPANRRPFTAADHAEYDGTKFGQERAFRRTASDKTPGPRHVSGDNDRSFTCPHGTPRSTGISTTALGGQARRGEADGPGVARGTGASECGFGGGVRPCDNRGVANRKGENVHEAEAEKEALLDYVQDLLDRIKGLGATCAGLERECCELSKRGESLKETEETLEEMRQSSRRKDLDIADARRQLEELQTKNEGERCEKEEMGRLYNELLAQLTAAEEEKEVLHAKALQATNREEAERDTASSLREQLDQCLRRLADSEGAASTRLRHAEEEKLALKNSLVGADERLATMENLQADAVDRGKELKTCQEQKSAREEALRTERGRTHHLIGALEDLETQAATLKKNELAETARAQDLEQALYQQETKVEEFIVLIEELQKRVLKLQSGAEMEGLRQQLEAAAGLAERQDELLEQASARLEILKDESRHLQEQLHRSQERSRTVKNVLGPVLGAAAARFRKVVKYATPTSASIYQKQGHMWDTGACDGNGNASWIMAGDQRRNAEDIVQEESVEDIARAAAEVLSSLLSQAINREEENNQQETPVQDCCAQSCFSPLRRHSHVSQEKDETKEGSDAVLLRASDPLPTPSIIDFRKAEDLQAQVFGSLSRTGCASGEIRGCCARRGSGGGGDGGGGWHGRIAEPGRSRVDGGSINGDVNISVRTQTRNNQNNSNKRNNNLRTPGTPGARVEGVRWRMGTELDSDSVSRMEGIRRGAGGQETQKQRGRDKRTSAVNEAGAAIERGGDMEERRRGSLFPERATIVEDNSWTPSGSSSPGARKIYQRLRDAQTTLKALRAAG